MKRTSWQKEMDAETQILACPRQGCHSRNCHDNGDDTGTCGYCGYTGDIEKFYEEGEKYNDEESYNGY